jgi:hypothetical protein
VWVLLAANADARVDLGHSTSTLTQYAPDFHWLSERRLDYLDRPAQPAYTPAGKRIGYVNRSTRG